MKETPTDKRWDRAEQTDKRWDRAEQTISESVQSQQLVNQCWRVHAFSYWISIGYG